jgi:hypothetical protein
MVEVVVWEVVADVLVPWVGASVVAMAVAVVVAELVSMAVTESVTITITIKMPPLQINASHETTRRHPSCPMRKLKTESHTEGSNKLPCGRSWQGATAPAAWHQTQETQPLHVPLTTQPGYPHT